MEKTYTTKIKNYKDGELLEDNIAKRNLSEKATLADLRSFLEKQLEIEDFFFIEEDGTLIFEVDEEKIKCKDFPEICLKPKKKKKKYKGKYRIGKKKKKTKKKV